MAEVELRREDLQVHALPMLCIRCGRPASVVQKHTFFWTGDAYGWRTAILRLLQIKWLTVAVPLCGQHQNLWRMRAVRFVIAIGSLVTCVAWLGVLGLTVPREPGRPVQPDNEWGWLIALLTVGLFVALVYLLIQLLGWRHNTIRAVEIKGNRIVLSGVADEFIDALEQRTLPAQADAKAARQGGTSLPR
jgi:hypothetical protein